MTHKSIKLYEMSPEELEEFLLKGVYERLDNLEIHLQPKVPEEYLSRQETADLLKVDLSTIHNWSVQGKLIKYGFGGKVYYKRSEIEAKIIPLNNHHNSSNPL